MKKKQKTPHFGVVPAAITTGVAGLFLCFFLVSWGLGQTGFWDTGKAWGHLAVTYVFLLVAAAMMARKWAGFWTILSACSVFGLRYAYGTDFWDLVFVFLATCFAFSTILMLTCFFAALGFPLGRHTGMYEHKDGTPWIS